MFEHFMAYDTQQSFLSFLWLFVFEEGVEGRKSSMER